MEDGYSGAIPGARQVTGMLAACLKLDERAGLVTHRYNIWDPSHPNRYQAFGIINNRMGNPG